MGLSLKKDHNLCDVQKMQARSIRSIRRSELSQAAFEAVIRYGLRGTTLEKVGEIAEEQIKSVTVKYIDESGHFVQFEKPEDVNLLIREFVEED